MWRVFSGIIIWNLPTNKGCLNRVHRQPHWVATGYYRQSPATPLARLLTAKKIFKNPEKICDGCPLGPLVDRDCLTGTRVLVSLYDWLSWGIVHEVWMFLVKHQPGCEVFTRHPILVIAICKVVGAAYGGWAELYDWPY